LDPKQPPVKRKPFAAILSHGFVQKVRRASISNFQN
jgi:ribonuclease P/MRP protein subunit RPP40